MPRPGVTGIGHEVDTSIADMVSDLRASTPTAAAEAVSPSAESLDALLASRTASLSTCCRRRIEALSADVARMASRPQFANPLSLFSAEAQAVDLAADRLSRALPSIVERETERLGMASNRLLSLGPRALDRQRASLATAAARLEDLSPLGTVARGYSITHLASGEIVRSVRQAPVGSELLVTVGDGQLACTVETVLPKNPDHESALSSLQHARAFADAHDPTLGEVDG